MPSRMAINTESVVGYNNMLRTADTGMKLGVNNHINLETEKPHCASWMADQVKSIRQTATHRTQSINRQQKPRDLLKRENPQPHRQTRRLQQHRQSRGSSHKHTDTSHGYIAENNNGPRRSASCKQGTCGFGAPALVGLVVWACS